MIPEDVPAFAFKGVLDAEEIERIVGLGKAAQAHEGRVDYAPAQSRRCKVCWLDDAWLQVRMDEVVSHINDALYNFELERFAEPFQYTVYGAGDYFDWHVDMGPVPPHPMPRKLSLTVQLSDPADYEGGMFQVRTGTEIITIPPERGGVIAFPSWLMHRVTPVTKGVRRALVVWCHGPRFR